LIVDFEPPTQPGRRTLATLVICHLLGGPKKMMQHTMRELLPLMKTAGFTDVEAGSTEHWAIAFARGRNPAEA
jgi:hypothetical protein